MTTDPGSLDREPSASATGLPSMRRKAIVQLTVLPYIIPLTSKSFELKGCHDNYPMVIAA